MLALALLCLCLSAARGATTQVSLPNEQVMLEQSIGAGGQDDFAELARLVMRRAEANADLRAALKNPSLSVQLYAHFPMCTSKHMLPIISSLFTDFTSSLWPSIDAAGA